MGTLWEKNYTLDELLEEFTVGRDYELDQELVAADCYASAAHAVMLKEIGILTEKELSALLEGLSRIMVHKSENNFVITRSDEDCHTAIENILVETAGEAGKKIHTGRSRNDQVLAALRVYSRDFLFTFLDTGLSLVRKLLGFAETHRKVPMPGRTHMQIAMPSSVGLWASSFAEELLDDCFQLWSLYRLIDRCPLGAAASYGVPLPLDRERTAELLGFTEVQKNVLSVNNSRGKLESVILDGLEQVMLTLSKMAQDLILFSLPEFGYFSLPKELCSGSSIMPQKKNPDGLELMRAKTATLGGYSFQVKGIIRSLPSGYNRDFQETKEPFIRGCSLALLSVRVMKRTIGSLQVHPEKLKAAFVPEIYATDAALEAVLDGMSFRDAYRKVGLSLDSLSSRNPDETIDSRCSTGTAGNLGLTETLKDAEVLAGEVSREAGRVAAVLKDLLPDPAG